ACCRRIVRLPSVKRAQTAVELAERYADGQTSEQEMLAASEAALAAARWTRDVAQIANRAAAATSGLFNEVNNLYGLANCATKNQGPYEPLRLAQIELLREIFGNPFRPVSIDPSWRTSPTLELAKAAYKERVLPTGNMDRECLAALSDALEEA